MEIGTKSDCTKNRKLAMPMLNATGMPRIINTAKTITIRVIAAAPQDFGPRGRLGKIFTDLPLALDRPIDFGVKAFCEICRRCSQACPVKAIPYGDPSAEVHNQSNIKGVRKWSVDGEKCFSFWIGQNSDCSICIRVCPYNKDYTKWWVRVGRRLAGTSLRRLMLWLDVKLGFGQRMPPKWWWRR